MSFVPEKIPENPRMAPEKYGMYALWLRFKFLLNWNTLKLNIQQTD